MAGLSEYPLLAEAADEGRAIPPDEEFRSGLRAVLVGLTPTP